MRYNLDKNRETDKKIRVRDAEMRGQTNGNI